VVKLFHKIQNIKIYNFFIITIALYLFLMFFSLEAWGDSGTLNEGVWYGNVAIPDNGGFDGRVNWEIDISGAPAGAFITSVDVEYSINHTYVGDLVVYLTTERNNTWYDKNLWDREGGSGQDIDEKETGLNSFDDLSPDGKWYLVAYDNAGVDVGEIDSWEIWIHWETIDPKPDLIAYNISASDVTVDPGQDITIDWTAKNQGEGSAGSTQQGVMWSTNTTITTSDTWLENEYLGSIGAGNTSPESHIITIPSNATPGSTYYIGVIADYDDDEPDESSESNNNDGTPVAVTINEPPNQSPTISITSGPSGTIDYNDITFAWQGSDSDGSVNGYEYKLDGQGVSYGFTSKTFNGLAEGAHTFEVRCYDNDGDYSDWESRSFTIDINNAPTISIISGPSGTIDYNDVTFAWLGSDSDGTVNGFEYRFDGQGFSYGLTSKTFNGLAEGAHTFEVRCYDNDGDYSDWESRSFTIGLNNLLIINDSNVPDPYNPGALVSFESILDTTGVTYQTCSYTEINNGEIDLDQIDSILVTNKTLENITQGLLYNEALIIYNYTNESIILPTTGISYDPVLKNLAIPSVPPAGLDRQPFPVKLNFDWSQVGKNSPTVIVTTFESLINPAQPATMLLVAKDFANGELVWGAVGVIDTVAGGLFIISLPACAATGWAAGGTCWVTAGAGAVKGITMVAGLSRDGGITFERIETDNNALSYDTVTGYLTYSQQGTINCNTYYSYDDELGYPVLLSDAPTICANPAFPINANSHFTFDSEFLYNEGTITNPTVSVGSFSEEVSYRISSNSSIELDIKDDVFGYVGPNGNQNFTMSSTGLEFQPELFLGDYLYASDFSDLDFIINSAGELSTILNVGYQPPSLTRVPLGQTLQLEIQVVIEVGQGGILQALVWGGENTNETVFKYVTGAQSTMVSLVVPITETVSGIQDYTVYVKFRPGVTEGPLDSSILSDIVPGYQNYQINWEPITVICNDDSDCYDGNVCTDDTCDSSMGCVYISNSASCNDGNNCTDNDVCSNGSCSGSTIDCSDGNICTDDSCDPMVGCINTNNNASCEDGSYCNGLDSCSNGTCSLHSGNPCPGPDGDSNCSESCNESMNSCTGDDPAGTSCGSSMECDGSGLCTCVPITECTAGSECGVEDDGCGGTINCGTCPEGESCNDHECIIIDTDNDGIPDSSDNCPGTPNGPLLGTCFGTSSTQCTSDNDCSSNCGESVGNCDMNQSNSDADTHGNVCDNCPDRCNTDQLDADTDDIGDVCDNTPGCDGCGGNPCEQACDPPLKAINPSPGNGATNRSIYTDPSWSNGGGATSYDVYFGTDPSPDSGEYQGEQTGTSYNPGTLNYSTTYYWRIDAGNSYGTTEGDVWSFTTEADGSGSVENDECADSIAVPFSGSTVGATGSDLSSCASGDTLDVWHNYTPLVSGEFTISTEGSGFDTTLAVFYACGGTEIACDDDGGAGTTSQIIISLTAGQTYQIRVAGYGGRTGNYVLFIESGDPCISYQTYSCYANDVYWYDSCGVREDKKEECGTAGCTGNTCNSCVSHDTYSCYANDVYWYDSCGVREDIKEDCGALGCTGNICEDCSVFTTRTTCNDQSPECIWDTPNKLCISQ
jgi:subtilisin-like proprotein convertase family protein